MILLNCTYGYLTLRPEILLRLTAAITLPKQFHSILWLQLIFFCSLITSTSLSSALSFRVRRTSCHLSIFSGCSKDYFNQLVPNRTHQLVPNRTHHLPSLSSYLSLLQYSPSQHVVPHTTSLSCGSSQKAELLLTPLPPSSGPFHFIS